MQSQLNAIDFVYDASIHFNARKAAFPPFIPSEAEQHKQMNLSSIPPPVELNRFISE
jgi:hypothetical protein